jgi:chromosome segregation ATPase
MANQLDDLRKIFEGLHRETQQKLQATTSQLAAAELRLREHEAQEKEALSRLHAVTNELQLAETELRQATDAATKAKARAQGEADRILRDAKTEALLITERAVSAIRAAASGVKPTV